ncbi:MAG: copper amine oxidase N-terminal domain-containing protein, partial [Syntrophomonas sp.]
AQALGVQTKDVVWDAGTATITLSKGDQAIQMQVGSKTLLINGAARQMDAAPEITSGRTFLPASYVAQGFGYSVDWDAASQTIKIYQGSSPDPSVNNINTQAQAEPKTWEDWPAASTDDPNHPWTIVFKQAMDTSTINSFNIYVSPDVDGSRRIEGVGITSSDSTHALVSPPTGGWKAETKYYLIITRKVLTVEGEPLKDFVRMPFSLTDDNSADSEGVLMPDYWIPDISKTYVSEFVWDNNSSKHRSKTTWLKNSEGVYQCQTVYDDGTSSTDTYTINGNDIEWSGSADHPEPTTHSLVSGTHTVLKPVAIGDTWENIYSTTTTRTVENVAKYNYQYNYKEKLSFIGYEEVNVLGTIKTAAHLNIKGESYALDGSGTASYNYDYWLVKGIGTVKYTSSTNNSGGSFGGTEQLVAISDTDIDFGDLWNI